MSARVWTECSVKNGVDVTCRGSGPAEPNEVFEVNANGWTVEVVVTCVSSPPQRWEAIDRARFERQYYLTPQDCGCGQGDACQDDAYLRS